MLIKKHFRKYLAAGKQRGSRDLTVGDLRIKKHRLHFKRMKK